MWFFWLAVGALAVVGAALFRRSLARRDARPTWFDWVAVAVLYAYWSFVAYFIITSFIERQPKAAGVAFGLFGLIGLVLVVVYRLLLVRRVKKQTRK